MPSHALLSSATPEHYTPPEVIAAAREVMGEIDLDPASCARANAVVKARLFFADDGLDLPWHGRVFCNPPGGKLNAKTFEPIAAGPGFSSAAVWWWKLLDEYRAGRVEQAIFICFSLNVFQCAQDLGYQPPYAFPFVVPGSRLRFWNERTAVGTGAPQHCNAIVYLPPRERPAYADGCTAFAAAFSRFGEVRL